MTGVAKKAANKTAELLGAPLGIRAAIAGLSQSEGVAVAPVENRQILAQNVSSELAERALELKYPAVTIYCEKIVNRLREKFRVFSGTASVVIEVRVSQDRLEGLESRVQLYADAVAQVLDQSRGDWGDGLFYVGGYEVGFGTVKHGGRNFLQAARISFEVEVSR